MYHIFLLIIFIFIASVSSEWIEDKKNFCGNKFMGNRTLCTSFKYYWTDLQSRRFKNYNYRSGCTALYDLYNSPNSVDRIIYFGDSYLRQIAYGMNSLLNYNKNIDWDHWELRREFEGLFERYCQHYLHDDDDDQAGLVTTTDEKKAMTFYGQTYVRSERLMNVTINNILNGKINLPKININDEKLDINIKNHFQHHTFKNVKSKIDKKTIILFSFGNHGLGKNTTGFQSRCNNPKYCRLGVNNATIWMNVLQNTCNLIKNLKINNRLHSAYWVSTHYRYKNLFEDEDYQHVKKFNEDMRHWIESGGCGGSSSSNNSNRNNNNNIGYIDVYNLTESLFTKPELSMYRSQVMSMMKNDYVHWGPLVNMIKANVILNRIINDNL